MAEHDVTSYASRHPGGAFILQFNWGQDATAMFDGISKHSRSDLSKASILGQVVADPVPTNLPAPTPAPINPTPPPAPTPPAPIPTPPAPIPTPPPINTVISPIPIQSPTPPCDDSDDEEDCGSPTQSFGGTGQVTPAQLAAHNQTDSCWLQINKHKAYDVTSYASRHPGGAGVIHAQCGNDATATFYSIGDHETSDLRRVINMGTVVVGIIASAPTPAPTPAPAAAATTPGPTFLLTPSSMLSDDGICLDHPTARFYVNGTGKTEPCIWLVSRPEEQEELCRPSHPSKAFVDLSGNLQVLC